MSARCKGCPPCKWCRGKGVCPSPWMHPTKDHPAGFVKCDRCNGTGNEPLADDAKRGDA